MFTYDGISYAFYLFKDISNLNDSFIGTKMFFFYVIMFILLHYSINTLNVIKKYDINEYIEKLLCY